MSKYKNTENLEVHHKRQTMDKLKVGDGSFTGSNVEIIRELFGKSVAQNPHGGYKIKENKWAAFIYLAIQQPNGNWSLPPGIPVNYWMNKPSNDNSKFTRECYHDGLKRLFADPADEYAVFTKTGLTECSFYGIFKLKEEKNDYRECVFERIKTELNCEEWR